MGGMGGILSIFGRLIVCSGKAQLTQYGVLISGVHWHISNTSYLYLTLITARQAPELYFRFAVSAVLAPEFLVRHFAGLINKGVIMGVIKKTALSIAVSVMLAACGGGDDNTGNTGNTGNQTEVPFTPKKLSHWEHAIIDEDTVYLQRDDGTLWKWPLVAAGKPQRIDKVDDAIKSIEKRNITFSENEIFAITQSGNVYKIDKVKGVLTSVATNVKQIATNMYLQNDGTVRDWSHNSILNIPKMERLLESDLNFEGAYAQAGIGKDGLLYYFKGIESTASGESAVLGASIVGAYPDAQAVLSVKDVGAERVLAILQAGNKWLILDNAGKVVNEQKFSGVINTRGVSGRDVSRLISYPGPTVITSDGQSWKWSDSKSLFVLQSECAGAQMLLPSGLLFMQNGSFLEYSKGGLSGNEYCYEQSGHLKDVPVKDALGNWLTVVGVKSDDGLIASVRKIGQSPAFQTFLADKPM